MTRNRHAATGALAERASGVRRGLLAVALSGSLAMPAMAVDLAALWDFSQPAVSEQRFIAALAGASADDALILQTQIARTYGLRRDFDRARQILEAVAPQLPGASAQARARHALETGRSLASATHPPQARTEAARRAARAAFEQALQIARHGGLDALAIDAIHMLAFVDTAPADQLRWAQEALAVAQASAQPDARRWEPSLRHNTGYALHQLGRHEEALAQFRQALALREAGSNAQATRVAHWMVAWTLRALGRLDEALAIQQRLEQENASAGAPDPHVFEELEQLWRAKGDARRAADYAQRRSALLR